MMPGVRASRSQAARTAATQTSGPVAPSAVALRIAASMPSGIWESLMRKSSLKRLASVLLGVVKVIFKVMSEVT